MAVKRILVADDSLTIQKVIRLALSSDGYEIHTVSDGKEALEQASLFRPDVCILDISLPQLDAYQIREHMMMKPDLKSIPVILMSSAFEKVDEARATPLSFSGHLVKPFDPAHLRSTLKSVFENHTKLDAIEANVVESKSSFSSSLGSEVTGEDPFSDLPPLEHTSDFPTLPTHDSFQHESKSTPPPFEPFIDEIQSMTRDTFEQTEPSITQSWDVIEPARIDPEPIFDSHPDEVLAFESPVQPIGAMSSHEIEVLIKTEVAKALERMSHQIQDRLDHEIKMATQEIVPNLAERVIKEEIRRLLSDPPV